MTWSLCCYHHPPTSCWQNGRGLFPLPKCSPLPPSMTGTRKLSRTFHVNMLARWEPPSAVCLHSSAVDVEGRDYEDIPTWPATPIIAPPKVNPELLLTQTEELRQLPATHEQVFTDQPGLTTLTSISIDTGESTPISSPPYRLPQARVQIVKDEIATMLRAGLMEASRSPWASPIVLVPKKDGSLRLCVASAPGPPLFLVLRGPGMRKYVMLRHFGPAWVCPWRCLLSP